MSVVPHSMNVLTFAIRHAIRAIASLVDQLSLYRSCEKMHTSAESPRIPTASLYRSML